MTEREVKIGFLWVKVAGWLIVALLSVIAWFTVGVFKSNTVEHNTIINILERDESDRLRIKLAIIKQHPELAKDLFPTRGVFKK